MHARHALPALVYVDVPPQYSGPQVSTHDGSGLRQMQVRSVSQTTATPAGCAATQQSLQAVYVGSAAHVTGVSGRGGSTHGVPPSGDSPKRASGRCDVSVADEHAESASATSAALDTNGKNERNTAET